MQHPDILKIVGTRVHETGMDLDWLYDSEPDDESDRDLSFNLGAGSGRLPIRSPDLSANDTGRDATSAQWGLSVAACLRIDDGMTW